MAEKTEKSALKKLRRLQANEVSLVNRGAVRRPFLVIKNQEGLPMADKAGIVPALDSAHEAKFAQIIAKHAPIAKDDDNVTDDDTVDAGLDERAMAALKAVYRILLPFKGQIPEDAVDDVLAELDLDDTGEDGQDDVDDDVSDDADEDTETQTEDDTAMANNFDPEDLKKAADWSPSKADGTSDEDHSKALEAAKKAYASCIGKAADDEDENEDAGDDDDKKVTKSAGGMLSEKHAVMIAKAESARAEAVRKAAQLEERVAKMEDEATLKSYEELVRRDCQVLGKDSMAQAKIIKSAYAANKDAGDAYVSLLRETAKMTHTTGIFKSMGTSPNVSFGTHVPTEQGSPQQQMDAMLAGLVQKGEAKDEASAWNAVMKTERGKQLYNEIHGGRN